MDRSDYQGTPSTAAIGGHPIHPMLVVFPIAFLVGALATDIAYWRTGGHFWALPSEWLLAAGLIMGALAAVAASHVRSLIAGAILAQWLSRSESFSRRSSLSSSLSQAGLAANSSSDTALAS
jgi:uncharacterized membrane protein